MSSRTPLPLPPITTLRRRAHTPPHAASLGLKLRLNEAAAANPLVPGTPKFVNELQAQRQKMMSQVKNSASRSSTLFEQSRILGLNPPNATMTAADRALKTAIERQRVNDTLRAEGVTQLPAYTPPTRPPPYVAQRSPSPVVTRRPTLDGQPPVKPLPAHLPEGRYTEPKNNRSTFTKVCNAISCGLFRSRRNRRGGRRTIRRRRQSRRSR